MNALEVLRLEHELIKQYLEYLEVSLVHLRAGDRPSRAFFGKGLEFARDFIGQFHHLKEEHYLFVMLAERMDFDMQSSLAGLRSQHDRGHDYLAWIGDSLHDYERGDESATAGLTENLAAYLTLMHGHVLAEDEVFLPLVQQRISTEELEQLMTVFQRVEQEVGEETWDRGVELLREMSHILVRPVDRRAG